MKKLKVIIASILEGHTGSLYALTESADYYITGGSGRLIACWPKSNLKDKFVLAQIDQPVYQFKTFKEQVFIGQTNGALMIIDIATKQIKHNIQLHDAPIYDIICRPMYTMTFGGDGYLKVLDADLNLVKDIQLAKESLRQAYINKDQLFVATSDATVVQIDLTSFELKHRFNLHEKSVFAVTVIDDQIISAGRDGSIFIQDLNAGEVIHKIPAHLSTINDFAINKDQSLLASASKDKSIRIWDTKTWQLLKVINREKYEYHSNSVNKIIWSADDKSLISVSDDRLGIIWKIEKV